MKIQADFYQGADRQSVRRSNQRAVQADIDSFPKHLVFGGFKPHLDMHGDSPEAAPLVFDGSLGGANQTRQTRPIDRFVGKKGGAGLKPAREGARTWIVTEQYDRRLLVESRPANFPDELDCIHGWRA